MKNTHKIIGLLIACVFMLSIFPASGLCGYDQTARLEELIAKAAEKKQKIDGVLGGMKSQAQSLTSARQGVVDAYKLLAEKKQKLNAIQSWNAFVGFVNVGFTALQKINPGNSAVVATATFLQDRASEALPNPPFQAKMKRLSESFNGMAPALRQLDKVCSLNDQEVADLLVSRGFVQNTWLQRWQTTPEAVKNSASVITGRTTFILERIGPAMSALYGIKRDMDSGIAHAHAYVDQLERESTRLDADIKSYKRQIKLAETYKEASEPKPTPKPVETYYPGPCPPKAYAQAYSDCETAWSDLKANIIDGYSYRIKKKEARSSAGTHYWKVIKPFSDAYNKEWESFWHTIRVILPTIDDYKRRIAIYKAASARLGAAGSRYRVASEKESKKIHSQLYEPLKKLWEKERQEQEICKAFMQRYNSWLEQRIEYATNDWEHGTSALRDDSSTIGQKSTAFYRLAWWPVDRLGGIASAMQRRPWSLFPGTAKVYKEWLEKIKEMEDQARELEQYCTSADSRFHGRAQEADAFAKELSDNIEVWLYVDWGYGIYRSTLATLSTTLMLYEANREVGQANMARYMEEIKKASQKANVIAQTMAVEPKITKQVEAAILSRMEAYNAYRYGNVVQRGSIARGMLEINGITQENLDKIKKLLPSLNNPEAIEEHALTLLLGEKGYDPAFSRLINPDFFKNLKQMCLRQLSSINASRSTYSTAYSDYASKQSAMESSLAQLERKLQSAAPSLLGLASIGKATGDWTSKNKPSIPLGLSSAWTPPDPAYFYDSTPQDMAYLKKVEELLTKYQKLVLPVFTRIKAGGYKEVRLLEEMAKKLKQKTPGWINLEPGNFNTIYNKYGSEAYKLYRAVMIKGHAGRDSPANKAYYNVMKILNACYSRHSYKWARIRIISDLNMTIRSINHFFKEPDNEGGVASAQSWKKEAQRKAGPGAQAQSFKSDSEIAGLIDTLLELEKKLGDYIANAAKQKVDQELAQIRDLYKNFAACYSTRDLGSLIKLMSQNWSAPDGSSLEDIEELLENSFSVFDNIEYKVENLNIQTISNGRFQVSYTSKITGYISDQDLEHNETSQVSDIVNIQDGKAIIMGTIGGNFWH